MMREDVATQYISAIGSTDSAEMLPRQTHLKLKRAIDLVVVTALIILILPVFCLTMAAIAAGGQSPFYSHARIGRHGKVFGCLKFRTMCRDADVALAQLLQRDPVARLEWETSHKLRRDPRVTKIGRFLRATSLDELPQLFNVLVGDMSLVGPRPVTGAELAKFYDPLQAAAYTSIRPGITGLWQVSGRSTAGYSTRVALDTLYAQRMSLKTDMSILFQTLDVVVRQKGAW